MTGDDPARDDPDSSGATRRPGAEPAEADARRFFALSTDLFCITGFDGRIRFASPSCARLLGCEPHDLEGSLITDRVHPDDLSAAQEAGARVRAGEPLIGFSSRFRHQDGSYRWLQWSVSASPEATEMYGVARDVTDQRTMHDSLTQFAEELSSASAQLERTSQMKSELLSNMGHELRTPLNAILGFTELLIDDPVGYDPSTRAAYLANIHESGRRLLALITDILELADVQAGRARVAATPFDIANVVTEAMAAVKPLAAAKRIRLIGEVTDAGDLEADRTKVRQILIKLLSNAIKFSPEEGEVSLAISRNDGEVAFSVNDMGDGIPAGDHGRIFERFQQLDSGSDHRYLGIGLAFALLSGLAELHGGRVEIESKQGEGSRFTVLLPLARPATDSLTPASAPEAVDVNDRRPLVLIVDDEDQPARRIVDALEAAGYRSARALDGQSALKKAQELRPAVITLDVMMPDLDGWQVLRLLKTHPATREIPVIIVSRADNQVLGRALGAVDQVAKPIDPEVLLVTLARLSLSAGGPPKGAGRA